MSTNQLSNPSLDTIIDSLNRKKFRATYGAVGQVIGVYHRNVGAKLSPRRPEVSWIVAVKTGLPSGYEEHLIHPDLPGSPMVRTGPELLRRMQGDGSAEPGK